MSDRGLLIVISGPSGAGKGTICANIRKEMPNLVYSVSMTTRAPRVGEEEGVKMCIRDSVGCTTYHIETSTELQLEWFNRVQTVGVTAGASTPDWIIKEVIETMKDFAELLAAEGQEEFKKGNVVEGTVCLLYTSHSAGSGCLEIEGHLFTGDTVFKQNVGNTDNYKSNPHDLITSLKYILSLSKELIIEPGHKESTILKDEEEFIKMCIRDRF